MKVTGGIAQAERLFRELEPGETFRFPWHGKVGDYLVLDLTRAAPTSGKPWDFRAAAGLEGGATIWLADVQLVSPTSMKAGPA